MKFDAWHLLCHFYISQAASLLDIGFLDFYGATYLMSTSWAYALILIRPTTGLGTTWADTVGFRPFNYKLRCAGGLSTWDEKWDSWVGCPF